ncbi:hypothetical protein [Aquiflexum gelatinilyticum]|uniref:Uncharacterized protein n=1 Tax=Aquiflexum gelatinilyticum TaxID=2961943 RepID=A0A9X2P673_9BACT|nr:hypothetical protein [Aquiflexum gelatinilyticum]MCR9015571.1 hypothetical protein [Aquiflexum gelatinilyticum]
MRRVTKKAKSVTSEETAVGKKATRVENEVEYFRSTPSTWELSLKNKLFLPPGSQEWHFSSLGRLLDFLFH